MTRINVGIPVRSLSGKHLIAEHREIKRIPNIIVSGKAKIKDIPLKFTLGKGHVKFFYNKCGYLLNRYKLIYLECIERGYKVQNYESAWDKVPKELMGDYNPSIKDREIVEQRIKERSVGHLVRPPVCKTGSFGRCRFDPYLADKKESMENYNYWMVWATTFESDERWQMVRAPDTWSEDMVFERAVEATRRGGVGGEFAEILRVEPGYETNVYIDYNDE